MTGDGRYVPLHYYLKVQRARKQDLAMSFRQIEAILGDGLPKPARKYPEWWANDEANEQARAWLAAGWQVQGADLPAESVRFEAAPEG